MVNWHRPSLESIFFGWIITFVVSALLVRTSIHLWQTDNNSRRKKILISSPWILQPLILVVSQLGFSVSHIYHVPIWSQSWVAVGGILVIISTILGLIWYRGKKSYKFIYLLMIPTSVFLTICSFLSIRGPHSFP